MSEYEKQDDEEGEYLQNVEKFEDPENMEIFDADLKRSYGGRDFDVEESIGERFLGLTEMFPDSVHNAAVKFIKCMEKCMKKTFSFACNISWIAFATTAILFAPVVYEYERTKDDDAQNSIKRRDEKRQATISH